METKPRRVLILDDDPFTLRLLREYLRAPHLHLVTCSEIEAAECLMEHLRFDVLISDLEVSHLGGLEGMRLIRHASTNFPDTLVIAFSGNVDDEVYKLGQAMGAAEVLRKPADLQRVRELVDSGLVDKRDPTQDSGLGEVFEMETLGQVLEDRGISALLQPIVALDAPTPQCRVFGVEGLARGPAGSIMRNPEILLGYASRKGRLLETELQCFEAVVREAQSLPETCTLFINVCPRSLSARDCAATLSDLVRHLGRREDQIVLELTEQQTILNPRAFSSSLSALRECGFRIALDDYGQGFANLHLVEELKPDYLKIDGFFCNDIHDSPKKQAMVRSTVEMARELGMSTIMEHVEAREELEALREFGVTYAQGYYFSKPAPARDLEEWFRERPSVTKVASVSPTDSEPPLRPTLSKAAVRRPRSGCKRPSPEVRYAVENISCMLGLGRSGEVINMGLGGFAVETGEPLQIGHSYPLQLLGATEVALTGEVVRCRIIATARTDGEETEPVYQAAFKFSDLSRDDRRQLLELIGQSTARTACSTADKPEPQTSLRLVVSDDRLAQAGVPN